MRAIDLGQYYRTPAVRQRLGDYCGACVFVTGRTPDEHGRWETAPFAPPADLDRLLERGAEVSRSMWDERDLLVHFDVDYQNTDRPSLPFEHPADVFVRLEPVRRAVEQLLLELDLPLLAVMTGRGYHWTGRIPLDGPFVVKLAALAPAPSWLATHASRRPAFVRAVMDEKQARAYAGVGMLIEFFAQEVIRRTASSSRIPIVVNGTRVGVVGYAQQRECVSLDFSYAGDPLDIRHLRMAFSAYRPPDAVHGSQTAPPIVIAIPTAGQSLLELLDGAREPCAAAALARDVGAEIPVATDGVARLHERYLRSPLAAFHVAFHAAEAAPPSRWPETYDRVDLSRVLPCVRIALERPNDLLLKPEFLQHVVRFFVSDGWHPRDIAGLVHSKYARDFQWGSRWIRMDPEWRAELNVRVFAGLIATGVDGGVDFNCRSAQEKGLCPGEPCIHDLRRERDELLARVA